MVTLYRPGHSIWHRLPTAPKLIVLGGLVALVSSLPTGRHSAALVPAVLCVAAYAVPGIGLRRLLAQVFSARWLLVVTGVGQLIFLGPHAAAVNTSRVAATLAIASLLALTTTTTNLLSTLERGLSPLRWINLNPQRIALMLTVTANTLPVLARAASQVRDAHRVRGGRVRLHTFTVPFLVIAMKYADDLGDALTARGVR
jgi:biotin transport system permease protein